MKTAKKLLCILLAALIMTSVMLLSSSAAESAESPIQVQIVVDKARYFSFNNVKATITVRNTGEKNLQNLIVSVRSDKHQLLFGNYSVFEIDELATAKSQTVSLEMALNRHASGVPLLNRIILFFTQLRKTYVPFDVECSYDKDSVSESIQFRHGSVNANLKATVWYEIGSDTTSGNPDNPPRPQVTNLDRYVIQRLNSGRYTAKMDIRMEGMTMPITYYTDGNNSATEMVMSDLLAKQLDIPMIKIGRIRLVVKGINTSEPKAYITWPGSYYEIDGGSMDGFAETLQEAGNIDKLLQVDNLEYLGMTTGAGYVCESYGVPGEDFTYNFYFSSVASENYTGLVRWEVINLQTGAVEQTMDIRLMGNVPGDAFDVKGQKKSLEDMEKLFGG